MKKILSLMAVAATVIFGAAQSNLVQNPGFEEGFAAPWAKGWNTSYTAPTLVTTGAHSGTNCVAYIGATATTGFYQNIPVYAGHNITISFWYKSSGDDTDTRIWSSYLTEVGGTTIYQAGTSTEVTTDPLRGPYNGYLSTASDWTQYTVDVTVPDNATILQLHVRTYNGGTSYFDDFSVTDKNFAVDDLNVGKNAPVLSSTLVGSEVSVLLDGKSKVDFYNLNGGLVKSVTANANEIINTGDLQAGVYLVKVANGGKTQVVKIVKK
jgi:hypothetical protein